jgi:hypothetical protein
MAANRFTVLVKTTSADREVTLQFNIDGRHVAIGFLGIELSETQAERLETLTTNYVGNLAEVLFHAN